MTTVRAYFVLRHKLVDGRPVYSGCSITSEFPLSGLHGVDLSSLVCDAEGRDFVEAAQKLQAHVDQWFPWAFVRGRRR